jgi:AcrR family transcriptional regulator
VREARRDVEAQLRVRRSREEKRGEDVSATPAPIVEFSRAERSKRDKRERILRAARRLFRTKGFERTTTSEIAELADVGKGTLFFHAKSKEALLVMMFQEELGQSIERGFATAPAAPLLEQVMHVFGVMMEGNLRELELARVFVREAPFVRSERREIGAVMASFYRRMSALLEVARARREIKKNVDPRALARNLFALYFFALVTWLGSGDPSPQGTASSLREMVELELRGALVPPSRNRR